MTTKKRTISVRLDDAAKRQVERAARLANQSAGAFLGRAGADHARSALLAWAAQEHRAGRASFSELAEQTGLAVEEIMDGMAAGDAGRSLDAFIACCRAVAANTGNLEFLRRAEEAVALIRQEQATPAAQL